MKQSQTLIPTLREVPADADIKSHQLLLRAGFIRQNASGIYSFLPLGKKVLQKVEAIIREEMDEAGGVEVLMPALQPAELWETTGRWGTYGPELMRLTDRHNRSFALGATHEEIITSLLRDEVNSYKKLPLTLYQIQSKFRDEKRPRFGLLRGREFLMKDAYSFHSNKESLDEAYEKLMQAYSNIFRRCGLDFRAVQADSGAIGGKDNHEFMVLSEIGEDTIAFSDASDYAANLEMAAVTTSYPEQAHSGKDMTAVDTPDQKTITEVAAFLNVAASDVVKSMLFIADEKPVLVLIRGDHEVNEIKVKRALNAKVVELATHEETSTYLAAAAGSIGPVGVSEDITIIADHAVKSMGDLIIGANKEGVHYKHAKLNRDFSISQFEDLRFVVEGDPSPDGNGTIQFAKGIEVGHVFKLGTVYSEPLNATVLDENGRATPMIMGCYGIGVSRTVAAIAEQFNDDKGLTWPVNIAPYDLHVIAVNMKDELQSQVAEELYKLLKDYRYQVLLDNRPERAGVKFADSDLIGLPVRITVGKRASEGIVEVKIRKTGEVHEVQKEELTDKLQDIFRQLSNI
ncbi:proline--tRNA ligase [Jeotgalibacillus proteolyticus]|uniref:Proline--tRNA ligase n=1 Tax=Jeotgalibacillus proteolyticus TaxID=2082395 RepID=A0A2S5GGA8_9BACL|nr:proline--tRNA ligase [Jeotgalibacillus proteolyticus]PPA72029.1 proline--tRNA ligase [Jeotgalibacillus proteolyticus]